MSGAWSGASATDTIFALASGAGVAAISVVRLSGAEVGRILTQFTGGLPPARRASLRALRDQGGATLDRAVVIWMPGPASYTGEDCAELHLHGGRAVLAAVSAAIMSAGARPAEAGEFTRRAVINGRMDLLSAEAVGDLVNAETEAQRKQAIRQLGDAQTQLLSGWRDRLRRAVAYQEALIDFPDEDLPPEVEAALVADLASLLGEMSREIASAAYGERLRHGLVFTITGAPNVGKSSLLNALAGQEAAIVSPFPGTTRDMVSIVLVLDGIKVTLVDTAGLHDTNDPVEAEGVRRALSRAASGDLIIYVFEAGPGGVSHVMPKFSAVGHDGAGVPRLVVANKSDLAIAPNNAFSATALTTCGVPANALMVSALTGAGIEALRDALTEHARRLTIPGGDPVLTRARHAAALRDTSAAIESALATKLPELRGEDLRQALHHLGRLTGAVGVEDILDDVFGAFCIGK